MPSEPGEDRTPVERVADRPRRLHPASLVFSLAALGRQFLVPALLFIFFAQGGDWQRWLILPFLFLLAAELVRYFTLTYRLTADELVIRSGLLSRTERHIPFERVQNIELVESAVHRVIGVVEVRLQTGSGSEVEAHLRVVSRPAVEELRRALFAARHDAGVTEAPQTTTLLRLPLGEVALHGLITGRGLVLLAAIAGVFFEYQLDWSDYNSWLIHNFVRDEELADKARLVDRMWPDVFERPFGSLFLWTAAFIPVLIGLRLLAAAWAVVRLYDFTLERTGDGLQSRYGLLTRVSATIPRARVQVLSVQEGVLHRWLRRVSVRVDTAGQFKQESGQLGSQWVAPIVRRGELLPLVQEVQPDAVLDPPDWTPVHPRAFTRLVRLQLTLIGLIAGVVAISIGPVVLVPALLIAGLAVWTARRLSRRLAIALTPTSVIVRTGAFNHRRSIARFSRVQSVSCTRSPFDRRWGMARISVDTAGGSAEHRIEMPYLDEGMATEIYGRLRAEVARAVRGAGPAS